jgi:signal transduction histidine kinase
MDPELKSKRTGKRSPPKDLSSSLKSFVREVNHKLRNPLQAILADLYVLERYVDYSSNKKFKPQIESLKRQVDAIQKIISDMTIFVETRQLNPERRSLNDLIRQIIQFISLPSNINLKLNLSEKIGDSLLDMEVLSHAITNLIMEAFKAMRRSGGDLSLSTYLLDDKTIEINISDTGPAIPEELLAKVFEILKTQESRGGGLDMATAKRCIERHNGTISVKNNPDKGITFTIHLNRMD